MEKNTRECLIKQLLIECGVSLTYENCTNPHGFELTGVLKRKALKLIYFHPTIVFRRK